MAVPVHGCARHTGVRISQTFAGVPGAHMRLSSAGLTTQCLKLLFNAFYPSGVHVWAAFGARLRDVRSVFRAEQSRRSTNGDGSSPCLHHARGGGLGQGLPSCPPLPCILPSTFGWKHAPWSLHPECLPTGDRGWMRTGARASPSHRPGPPATWVPCPPLAGLFFSVERFYT